MINKVIEYIEANRESYVERLMELLRIQSISTDPQCKEATRRAGEWIKAVFDGCGIKAELAETPGHPSVMADGGGPMDRSTAQRAVAPTVLVYGHYDVQPTGDESLWDSPPFEPTIRDGAIYARGSADDKGQVLVHLLAAEAWMKTAGKLPVRAKYLIEGEEEISSPNLEAVIRDNRERLACDYIALSDTSKLNADTPAITYGTKGLVYKEITVYGPKQDLHSGSFGGAVGNPGNALASIIASLKDIYNRCTIPGFYDDVRELDDAEREQLLNLPFDEAAYRQSLGVDELVGERGYPTQLRKWVRPTLDVNGICGGFTGEGASTIIPAKVMAKVSMRLVPDQDPAKISQAFDQTVKAAAPAGVRVEVHTHASCGPYVSELGSPGMTAAAAAIEAAWGKAPVFMREGGSLPILPMFKEILGADSIMMGFCDPNSNVHGPNEWLGLDDFHNGIKAAAHFLDKLAVQK